MARGDVFTTLQNLTRRLEEERIPYALIAVWPAAHGSVRMTQDVDILMMREGLETFKQRSFRGVAMYWHFQCGKTLRHGNASAN
jgi:hypothetical protein